MSQNKIWLSSPHMGGTEQAYINEAFAANWIAPIGPQIDGFEQDLQNYFGDGVSVTALNSATAALHLGLILLGVQQGDEVICQSMTFAASANPILYLGATPIFVDSEIHTWNLCPETLEEAIIDRLSKGKKPKVIIAVHLYGVPYQVEAIQAIADKYNIPVLEDAASTLGSNYKGKKCGTFGTIGVVSFNGNKIITTSGGGAIVTHQKEMKEKALYYATQARDTAPHYQHSAIGYNYRMSNISAAIGRGQMEVLDTHIQARRAMQEFYKTVFKDIKGVTIFSVPNEDYYSNYWLSAITIQSELTNGGVTREILRIAFEDANIESRPLWKPMHLQPVFEKEAYYGGNVAETLFEQGLCLPSGSNITEEEKKRIQEVVEAVFNI
ncbi:MAG: DegT/DnrJ/EryC1/StrS family aminotransferase [Flavobacterium sp.]